MRLSFILSSLRLSGGVFVVIEYAKRLTTLGYEIQLVVPKGTTDPDIVSDLGESITIQEASIGIPPIKFLQLTQFIHLIFSLAWVTQKSDVIIATHTPTTIPALIASHILRKGKSVWLYQDYLEMFTGRPYESWLVKNALRWFNCALVVSEYSKIELKRNSPGRVVYVGEGLSHSEFFHPLTPEHRITRENKKIILTLGDPRQRKGFYDFLDAAEMVYENIPNIEIWIFAKEKFQFSIEIPYKYIIRPERSELARLYASCDVFVSASWWESFGLPPLEAMACGAPVVMTDSRGVREYAIPDINCLMTPPRDPQSLAKAITRVLTNNDLTSLLRKNGPPTAAKFTWDKAVNRFEQAIMDIF